MKKTIKNAGHIATLSDISNLTTSKAERWLVLMAKGTAEAGKFFKKGGFTALPPVDAQAHSVRNQIYVGS
jgi:hypothetical protein